MRLRLVALTLLLGGAVVVGGRLLSSADAPAKLADRKPIDFTLKDPRDQSVVRLADLKDKKAIAIVFIGTECPLGNQFVPVLADLDKEYAGKGVQFLAINSNRQDTPDRVAAHARKYKVPFPVLKDVGNVVADQMGAKRTPEAFVLNAGGRIVYQGRIDDQFGINFQRPKPTRRDLAAALDEVLAGKPVTVASTSASGCLISRVRASKSDGSVTFNRDVSRILQKNCQDCHRAGQIGPMALLTYEDAAAWAETIREVAADRRMPPWHADPKHGKWVNDRSLPEEDRKTLLTWVDQGTPRGDDKDLPAPRQFPEGWAIGKPDQVFAMPRPFSVPAEVTAGGVPYQYFSVSTNFTEDRWVQAAESHAGAPEVVHHIVVFIVPKGELFRPDGPGNVLCGTAPGEMPMMLKTGFAKKIPAGARLVFQMHYTPNGRAQTDVSSVGVIFSKEKPKHRILTKPVHPRAFLTRFDRIPAGADNYEMETTYTFRDDVHIINFMPHMHLRGKDFTYEAIYPGGKKEVLLSVPRYQFGWQTVYRSAEPLAMPRGSKLRCVAHFDNSAGNPNNPDPMKNVYWGDQTWEEMMIGWIDYYADQEKP